MAKIGTAWIDVEPNLDAFRRKVASEMRPIAREMSQNFSPTVNTRQVDRALIRTGRNSENLAGRLLRLKLVTAALSFGPAVSGLNAMAAGGVAAAGSLTPLAGLLATLPSLASAAGQAMATVKLGTSGVGDALKAAVKQQMTASTDSGAAMERQRAAAERIRSALEALSDANVQEERAQRAQTQAVKDARREMEGLREAAEGGATAQKRAALTLRDARKELASAEVGADAGKIADARLAVIEAEENVAATRRRVTEARRELAEAERAGVGGMPQVVAANEAVTDAQKGTARAARDLKMAQQDASSATDKQSASATAYNQALAQLSPRARQFVKTLLSYRPALKQLQATSAEGFFPGVERGIAGAMGNFDVVKNAIGGTSREMGRIAENAGKFLGRKDVGKDIATQAKRNDVTIRRAGQGSLYLADALRHVTIAAGPLVDWLTKMTLGWTKNLAEEAKAGRESGRTAAYFERTRRIIERLLSISGHARSAIAGIFKAGRQEGDSMWASVDRLAGRFDRWVNSTRGQNALKRWFADGRDTLHEMAGAVRRMTERFRELRGQGRTSFDAFAVMGSEAVARFLSLAAETLARRAPAVAEAFIHGFFAANAWGRALVAIWLIRKMGGVRAFAAAGSRSGGIFGSAFAATSSTAAAKGMAGAGFRAKLAAGLKGAVPGLAATAALIFGPELAKQVQKLRAGRGQSDSRSGLPISAPRGIPTSAGGFGAQLQGIGRQMGEVTPGRLFKAFTGGGAIEDPEAKLRSFGDTAARTFARLKATQDPAGLARLAGQARALARDFPKHADSLNAFARRVGGMVRPLSSLKNEFGRLRNGAVISLRDIMRTTQNNFATIRKHMGTNSAAGRRAVQQNFSLGMSAVKKSMADGTLSTKQGMEAMRSLMKQQSGLGKAAIGKNYNAIERQILRTMTKGGKLTEDGMKYMREVMVNEMKDLGLSKSDIRMSLNKKASAKKGFTQPGARGGLVSDIASGARNFAKGGMVQFGRAGQVGRDTILSKFGRQDVRVAPGEVGLVLNRHQQKDWSNMAASHGFRGIRDYFDKRHRKHYEAAGGGVMDGRKRFAGGGIVELLHPFNDPGGHGGSNSHLHIAMPNVRRLIALGKRLQKAGWHVSEHPAFGGVKPGVHSAGGYHYRPGGQAIDVNWPDAGAEGGKIKAILGMLNRLASGKGTIPGGQTGGAAPKLARLLVKGDKGAVPTIVQGYLDEGRRGMQKKLNQVANEFGAIEGAEPGVDAGNYTGPLDRSFPKHSLQQSAGKPRLSPGQVRKLHRRAGLPGVFSAIVDRESKRYPGVYGLDPGGTIGEGLHQITFGVQSAETAATLRRIGDSYNPWRNTLMAKWMYDRSGIQPWNASGPYQRGGIVGKLAGFARGGLPAQMRRTFKSLQTGKTKPRRKALTNLLNKFKKLGLPKSLQDTIKRHDNSADVYGELAGRAGTLTTDNPVEGGDPILGRVNGLDEAHYLTRQLSELFNLRNALARAHKLIVEHKERVRTLVAQAKKALENVRKKIRVARKNPKKNKRQIDGLMRVQAAIKDRILPGLKDRNTKLGDTHTTLVTDLQDVQGAGSPMGVLGRLPAIGVLGGTIFDAQNRLRELNIKQPNTTDKTDNVKSDLLAQLLREANLRTAVSERQFDIFRNMPPFGGSFATGGVVPGPAGAPRTIIAHGGETVVPETSGAQRPIYVIVEDGAVDVRKIRAIAGQEAEVVTRRATRGGRAPLPGRGGGGLT